MDPAELKEALRAHLNQSLEERLEELMARVNVEPPAMAQLHEQDFDVFHACCQKLVSFIQDRMTTSSDFSQQMERIIQACFTNSSRQSLRSLVTKEIWFNMQGAASSGSSGRGSHSGQTARSPSPAFASNHSNSTGATPGVGGPNATDTTSSSSVPSLGLALRTTPPHRSAGGMKTPERNGTKKTPPVASSGPHVSTRSSARKRRQPSPPPMRTTRSSISATKRQQPTRQTRTRAAARQLTEPDYETVSDSSDEEPVVLVKKAKASSPPRARRTSRVPSSQKMQEDSPERESSPSPEPNRLPPVPSASIHRNVTGAADVIGDMCYPDRRTPAQNRFFKDRLRKAIEFVDAQMCRPPLNKRCSRECAFLRGQMCNQDKACKNRVCRLWHEVEAHSASCQNSHCEFRNRIMQRESMHKIQLKERKVSILNQTVHEKKRELEHLKHDNISEREKHIETILLNNELEELGHDVDKESHELDTMRLEHRNISSILEEIGVFPEDDDKDNFPDFKGHYVDNKTPTKKKPGRKRRQEEESEDEGPSEPREEEPEDEEQEEKESSPPRPSPPRKTARRPAGRRVINDEKDEGNDAKDGSEKPSADTQEDDAKGRDEGTPNEDASEEATTQEDGDKEEAEGEQQEGHGAQAALPENAHTEEGVADADADEDDDAKDDNSTEGTKDQASPSKPVYRKSGADLEQLMNKENEEGTSSPLND